MTCTLHVAWDGRLAGYDFGPGHPMAPLRLRLTMELAQALGLGRQDGVTVAVPAAATDAELELVHDPAYAAETETAKRLEQLLDDWRGQVPRRPGQPGPRPRPPGPGAGRPVGPRRPGGTRQADRAPRARLGHARRAQPRARPRRHRSFLTMLADGGARRLPAEPGLR
jgi:hypothetical protein